MSEVLVYPHHKKVVIPYRADVDNLVPGAKRITVQGRDLLAVPMQREEIRLLRNLGINAPAPILHLYDWSGDTPFDTQRETAALLTTNSRAYVLNDMGTGKTRATLHAINYLIQSGEIRKALVVAPLSTLTTVWSNEVFEYFPHLSTAVLHGTRAKRLQLLQGNADIYIINHDGIHTIRHELAARTDIDVLVIDELAAFRNAQTRRWKALQTVAQKRKFVWGLTGAPIPSSPTDAWAQCRIITPESVPKYFTQFREATMLKVSQFRWVPRQGALQAVHKAMQPAVRYKRSDCLDLPPTLYSTRAVDFSSAQKDAYDKLVKQAWIEFSEGRVTALNAGVLLNKLLQVACGFVYTNDGGVVDFQSPSRFEALREAVEETPNKTIVFVPFIEAVKQVYAAVSKYANAELVYGDTPIKDRNRIFASFQRDENPRVLVAHPKCMAHGLTLTAADTVVWFSPLPDLEIYEQANARVTRPSQKNNTLVVHLEGSAVEKKVYQRLRLKGDVQGALMELFEDR
jgi:SNF2 family DNA or RNA helicase